MSNEIIKPNPEENKEGDPGSISTYHYDAPIGKTDSEEQAEADPPKPQEFDRDVFLQHLLDCREEQKKDNETVVSKPRYIQPISEAPIQDIYTLINKYPIRT